MLIQHTFINEISISTEMMVWNKT